jgi:hypothetical protein
MFRLLRRLQLPTPQRLAISSRRKYASQHNGVSGHGTGNSSATPNHPTKLSVVCGIFSCPDQYLKSNPKASSPYEWQYTEPNSIKLRLAVVIGALPTYTIPCDNRSGIIAGFSPAYESATVAHHRTCALALVGEEFFWRSL